MIRQFNIIFDAECNTNHNYSIFGSLMPDGWFITKLNDLIIIEDKKVISNNISDLIKFYDSVKINGDFRNIFLIATFCKYLKSFKYSIHQYKSNKFIDLNYKIDQLYDFIFSDDQVDIKTDSMDKNIALYNLDYLYASNYINIFQGKTDMELDIPINKKDFLNIRIAIKDYFELAKARKKFTLKDSKDGLIPLIGTSKYNTGICKFINDFSFDGSYITISKYCSTNSYVRNGKFAVIDDVIVLKPLQDVNLHICAMAIRYQIFEKNKISSIKLMEMSIEI